MQYNNKYVNRFWSKVDKAGECWIWKAYTNEKGYGYFYDGRKMRRVHRFAYELLVGSIPAECELDHTCRNRNCVKPSHLEPVSHQENCKRGIGSKKSCKYGHECGLQYNYPGSKQRTCRKCVNERNTKYRLENWQPPQPRVQKTHCPQGHEFTPENTYTNPNTGKCYRECVQCRSVARARWQERAKK